MQHYFDDTSLLRQVVGHRVTGLSGPRALLLMAAHPVAFAGFFAHTGALDDPYARLMRTATVMDAVAFGTKARADKLTAHVRAMHRTVSGELGEAAGPFAAGTPYRADDPELLLWILAALAESAMLVYGKYLRPLSSPELHALCADYRIVRCPFAVRAVDGLPDRGRPVRAAGAGDARRQRRLRGLHGRHVRERRAGGHAGGAGAGDRHRPQAARRLAAAAGARAGQPDHGRAAARRPAAPVRVLVGPRARRRGARRRGVRAARAAARAPAQPSWLTAGSDPDSGSSVTGTNVKPRNFAKYMS